MVRITDRDKPLVDFEIDLLAETEDRSFVVDEHGLDTMIDIIKAVSFIFDDLKNFDFSELTNKKPSGTLTVKYHPKTEEFFMVFALHKHLYDSLDFEKPVASGTNNETFANNSIHNVGYVMLQQLGEIDEPMQPQFQHHEQSSVSLGKGLTRGISVPGVKLKVRAQEQYANGSKNILFTATVTGPTMAVEIWSVLVVQQHPKYIMENKSSKVFVTPGGFSVNRPLKAIN